MTDSLRLLTMLLEKKVCLLFSRYFDLGTYFDLDGFWSELMGNFWCLYEWFIAGLED